MMGWLRTILKTALTASFLLAPLWAEARYGRNRSIEERTKGADHAAVVTIEETRSERVRNEYGDELIVTHARMKVDEMLKGKFDEAQPELTVEGGEVDGIRMEASDQPVVKRGEKMVVFLNNRQGQHRPFMRSEGVMKLNQDQTDFQGSRVKLDEIRQRVRKSMRGGGQ